MAVKQPMQPIRLPVEVLRYDESRTGWAVVTQLSLHTYTLRRGLKKWQALRLADELNKTLLTKFTDRTCVGCGGFGGCFWCDS